MNPPVVTKADIAWCLRRAAEYEAAGLSRADACEIAARERSEIMMADHDLSTREVSRRMAKARHLEAASQRAIEHPEKAPGARPTLKASLGDMAKIRRPR